MIELLSRRCAGARKVSLKPLDRVAPTFNMRGTSKNLRNLTQYLFGEDQGRYILEVEKANLDKVIKMLNDNEIYYENIGKTQVKNFEIENEFNIFIRSF